MDIDEILAELALGQYRDLFVENDIEPDMLSGLTSDDLREIGIASLGHRKKILAAIAARAGGGTTSPDPAPDSAESAAERREVTTVFADLTGYTRLSRELEAEDMHSILGEFYGRFDAIVKRMGGTVDRHIGDCVMAVFGAPVSYGNDAERALRAAMAMHRAMEEISLRFGRALSVHIGVAAGNVLFASHGQGALRDREFTLTGDSVNLASRLADQARGGETLITSVIQSALGERIECDAPGTLAVKGFDEPVPVYRLIGFRDRPADRPLVGRTVEIAALRQALLDSRALGRGETLAVVADAGLGKSRLMEEFGRIATDMGFGTHKALVLDFGLGEAQDPVSALLRSLCGLGGRAEAPALRAALAELAARGLLAEGDEPLLTAALGAAVDRPGRLLLDAMSDAARDSARRAMIGRLLCGLAAERPLLLIVEDVHWADAATMSQLAALAETTAQAPVLLALTTRQESDPLDHAWRAAIGPARLRRIELGPLAPEDAIRIARGMQQPPDDVIRDCVARAEGNPFFLEQLLSHAREKGHDSVPGSIQSIIQSRLDRLEPADRRILQAAAILGQRFTMEEVTVVARMEIADERPLIEAMLIRPLREGYLFAHALIREAVLRTILRDELRALHARAAQLFRGRDAVLHAEHLAAAHDPAAAAAYLTASQEARTAHRKETALGLAERGLALAEDARVRGALFRLKGDMLRDLGRGEEAIEAFGAARAIAERPEDLCRAQIGIVAAMRILDRIDDAYALLDEVEATAQEAGLARELSEIHYFRGSLHFPRGQLEGCLNEHEKSLAWAERCDDPERRALALSGLGDAHYASGRMFTAHKAIEQCLALAERHGLGAVEAANRFMLATVRIYMNETERALADALASAQLARKVGHARAEIVSRLTAGWILTSMGDTDSARAEVEQGHALAESLGAKRFEPFLEETAARIALTEGRRAEAETIAEGALVKLRALGAMSFIGPWLLATVARCASDPARRAEALAEGEALLDAGCVGHNHFRFPRYAIEASAAAGDWTAVRRYADRLARYTAREPTPWSDFHIARARALADAGEGIDAGARLRALRADAEAAALHAAIPAIDAALARGTPDNKVRKADAPAAGEVDS